MLKLYHFRYRQKISFVILIIALIPFITIGAFYLLKIRNEKTDEIIGNYKNQFRTSVDNVNSLLDLNLQKAYYIISNNEINTFLLMENEMDLASSFTFNKNVKNMINALEIDNINSNPTRNITIYVYNESILSGQYVKKITELESSIQNEVSKADADFASDYSTIWKFRHFGTDPSSPKKQDFLCLYKKYALIGEKLLAVVEVRIPWKKIVDQFKFEIPKDSFILYYMGNNSENMVIAANGINSDRIPGNFEEYLSKGKSGKYFVITMDTRPQHHKILIFLPKSLVLNELKGITIIFIIILCILIICIFITARVVSFYLTRRLTNLIAGIDTNIENLMEGQELSFNAGNDEFTRIYIRFYEIIQKIREYYSKLCEYEKERKVLELEKKVLELELLQARINPHFLYNTLSALRFAFPNEKLSKLVASMAKYYRVALNRGENTIKVGDELDMVEEYLKIQKFTYISDFSYLIDMPDNVREYMIIKHLLQPIVENAFIHGVSGLETGGVIKIIGGLYEGKLVFNIIDNGIGIEQEKIIRIQNGENVSMYGGYGLRNVIRRIKTYYGNDYGLSIKSNLNEGTAVTITIPYKA